MTVAGLVREVRMYVAENTIWLANRIMPNDHPDRTVWRLALIQVANELIARRSADKQGPNT